MMGERQVHQDALFYEFSLERHVPAEHLLRSIDRFVEFDGVRCELAPFYSEAGRPSIDPELMIRMLIVGYCFSIRSERRLCEEVHLNLAYRWFWRLGLDGAVPDHSTYSKNRHGRFRDSDLLRKVFETTVRRCMVEGLVGGEGFAVDASMIKADANRQRSVPGRRVAGSRGGKPCRAGVSGGPRRCHVRRGNAGGAEVRLARRPGRTLDGSERRARLPRLLRQLPDLPEARRHRRCRGDSRSPTGRGDGPAADD
jgi:transposase